MAIIEVKNLYKSFGSLKVFEDMNLDVKKSEVIAIIGASGCGKSVLLRLIEMLEKPDSGQVFIDGEEITKKGADIRKIRKHIGMVYQDFGLFSNMNVMENLCIAPIKLLHMDKEEAKKKAMDLLSTVGLSDKANYNIKALSGGQKQRIAICRCMMMDPEIILFDEPTSALDPTMVGEVLATIRMLARRGLTMIIVTHEMNFAKQIADRVIFLAEGKIYEEGTPKELFDNPKKEKTIDFIRKLKHLHFHIDSKNYDMMALQGAVQEFSIRYGFSKNESYRLQICIEEMSNVLINNEKNNIDIDINVSFSELDNVCDIEFRSKGKEFNPFDLIDKTSNTYDYLSLMIIDKKAKNYDYKYENETNIIKIKL